MDEDPIVDIPFEYKGSRKELHLSVSSICHHIQQELCAFGVAGAVMTLSSPQDSADNNNFFLQRWCRKWGAFVNVENMYEVCNDDKVTVVCKPISSPTKVIIMCK